MGQVIEIRKRGPTGKLHNVPPGRRKYGDLRSREYLLPEEVAALVNQAGQVGRHSTRDRTMI